MTFGSCAYCPVIWNCCGDLMCGINPHTWVVSPGCAPLAGCRCLPLFGDDMPHDALMWGHGGRHAGNLWPCAWARHFPWGQPPDRMGKSGRPCVAVVTLWCQACHKSSALARKSRCLKHFQVVLACEALPSIW